MELKTINFECKELTKEYLEYNLGANMTMTYGPHFGKYFFALIGKEFPSQYKKRQEETVSVALKIPEWVISQTGIKQTEITMPMFDKAIKDQILGLLVEWAKLKKELLGKDFSYMQAVEDFCEKYHLSEEGLPRDSAIKYLQRKLKNASL